MMTQVAMVLGVAYLSAQLHARDCGLGRRVLEEKLAPMSDDGTSPHV
jgi:hypothetical protein